MDNSNYTLERIAEETGFGSYTYFHRVFRERMEWRQGYTASEDKRKKSLQHM